MASGARGAEMGDQARHAVVPGSSQHDGNSDESKRSCASVLFAAHIHVDTDVVQDMITIRLKRNSSEEQEPLCVKHLLKTLSERYHQWHSFTIYGFNLNWPRGGERTGAISEEVPLRDLGLEQNLGARACEFTALETEASKERREKERIAAEAERKRREEEARIKEEIRRKKIEEITEIGKCWNLENNSAHIDVSIESGGMIARNKGSLDQWCAVHALKQIPCHSQYYFSLKILSSPETTNSWRICVGVVPLSFKIEAERRWVGAQKSWGYIAGTGGKCHDSGKSAQYGESFVEGDIIGVFLNFDKNTVEFFKNGVSQGVAFDNLDGPVYPAVSLTAKDAQVELVDHFPDKMVPIMDAWHAQENDRAQRWEKLSSEAFISALEKKVASRSGYDVFHPAFSLQKDKTMYYPSDSMNIAVCEGSGDKWRVCRGVKQYSEGINFVEFEIVKDNKTSNTWRFCFGIAPVTFRADNNRAWVGSQGSWAYIAGTGGKSHNSGQSTSYGEAFGLGDSIGILFNFEEKTIEFFKNGVSQGVAFRNLEGPVVAVASFTGTNSSCKIRGGGLDRIKKYMAEALERERKVARIIKDYGNIWDLNKCSRDMKIEKDGLRVRNMGSKDKWRACGGMLPYSSGRRYFELLIEDCPTSSNSWKICVGVVPRSFDFAHQKLWVGSQCSWGYILGTGGKCYDSGRSGSYGSKFARGDRIGVLMDFDNTTLEFFKNGVSQGVAFTQLKGPVFPAVSLTGKNSSVSLDGTAETNPETMERLFLYS